MILRLLSNILLKWRVISLRSIFLSPVYCILETTGICRIIIRHGYVLRMDRQSLIRERIGAVMGGKILQLASERLIEKGRMEGRSLGITEGRVRELCSMVQDGDITLECAAKRLKITVPELKKQMLENGYGFQEI